MGSVLGPLGQRDLWQFHKSLEERSEGKIWRDWILKSSISKLWYKQAIHHKHIRFRHGHTNVGRRRHHRTPYQIYDPNTSFASQVASRKASSLKVRTQKSRAIQDMICTPNLEGRWSLGWLKCRLFSKSLLIDLHETIDGKNPRLGDPEWSIFQPLMYRGVSQFQKMATAYQVSTWAWGTADFVSYAVTYCTVQP